jgi:hypothetical protein
MQAMPINAVRRSALGGCLTTCSLRNCWSYSVHLGFGMFRIVLQPEEEALLHRIREGRYPSVLVPRKVLLKFIALRMLSCDAHGNLLLTELAEVALARMKGKVH